MFIGPMVAGLTEVEELAAFTLEFTGDDNRQHDLWTVRNKAQQRGQVIADYNTEETPEFTPNVGSVQDSKVLGPVVRENRVAELAAFYQNEENDERSIFE